MIVHVKRRVRFSAAHSYANIPADQSLGFTSAGLMPERYIHGHNYVVDVTVKGAVDERSGMVVNITEIDSVIKQLVSPLDQTYLEQQHPEVAWGIPTTENLALWFWENTDGRIPNAALSGIRVAESDFLWSEYRGEDNRVVYLTKTYEFAAAHRLHSEKLSDEENLDIFGKCNNMNGHGHNYGLEVTMRGAVSEKTGMCCDIGELDRIVNEVVVKRFDHKHLNLDVPEFASLNPTSENVAVVIWNLLRPSLGDGLHRICVRETERNYFEYFGQE